MRINGRSALTCKENIGSEVQRLQIRDAAIDSDAMPEIIIAPMGNMQVIKDLVVDIVVSGTT